MTTRIDRFRKRLLALQNRATSTMATDDMDGMRARFDEICDAMEELASCIEEVEERLYGALNRSQGLED